MAKSRVRYKGLSDVREITQDQLKAVGIEVSADLVFDRSNGFAMNIDLNDELTKVLRAEGTFSISEIKDDKTLGEEYVKATVADDTVTAAKVVDATTGQSSANPNAGHTPSTPPAK